MANVINLINPKWFGGVRVSGYRFFWYLRPNSTISVGVYVPSVLHSVIQRVLYALVKVDMSWRMYVQPL
jgi:hypothetical protein